MKLPAVLLTIASLLGGGPAHAQFMVDRVEAHRTDDGIRVDVELNLSLTDATEDALAHGVPLIVVHEIVLQRAGWPWNHTEQQISARHRLRYHALSGRYVVESNETVLDTFRSISDALDFIDTASARFPTSERDAVFKVAVRSRIDINALPAPLRPTALFSPQWQLSSDWSQWPVDGFSTN
jgi:hypothetical protein